MKQKLRRRGNWHQNRPRIPLGRKDALPEPLWIDLMALLYLTNLTTCSALADALASASHAQWPRLLPGPWAGQRRLNLALRALFSVVGGSRLVDDTVIEKP
jgi:hypothetical protein